MDTQPFELLARLTPALHDTGCACGVRASHGALRAEARRQLRWQQRALARTRTTPTLGTPYLVVPAARAGLAEVPDWLRQAGEEVPSWFDHGRSLVWTSDVTRGTASV